MITGLVGFVGFETGVEVGVEVGMSAGVKTGIAEAVTVVVDDVVTRTVCGLEQGFQVVMGKAPTAVMENPPVDIGRVPADAVALG